MLHSPDHVHEQSARKLLNQELWLVRLVKKKIRNEARSPTRDRRKFCREISADLRILSLLHGSALEHIRSAPKSKQLWNAFQGIAHSMQSLFAFYEIYCIEDL